MCMQLKERQGSIERILPDGCSAVCKGLFKKETDMAMFERAKVTTGRGEEGYVEGKFGMSGKFKVQFAQGLQLGQRSVEDNVVYLRFKRFLFDQDKHRIRQ
eukprot:GHUV01032073.1.p2 GENE.GHUV01032073.1~~GHUV01032073.1.p2  ORF type:complete len:101 (-),score=29.38 GHUV01032073.1:497-799(-)